MFVSFTRVSLFLLASLMLVSCGNGVSSPKKGKAAGAISEIDESKLHGHWCLLNAFFEGAALAYGRERFLVLNSDKTYDVTELDSNRLILKGDSGHYSIKGTTLWLQSDLGNGGFGVQIISIAQPPTNMQVLENLGTLTPGGRANVNYRKVLSVELANPSFKCDSGS